MLTEFHATSQSNIPKQVNFSPRADHVDLPLPPHRAVPDYLLWGYVKSKVYEARAVNTNDLERRIRESVEEFPKDMLQCVTAFC